MSNELLNKIKFNDNVENENKMKKNRLDNKKGK
jgi:hypothetical protein